MPNTSGGMKGVLAKRNAGVETEPAPTLPFAKIVEIWGVGYGVAVSRQRHNFYRLGRRQPHMTFSPALVDFLSMDRCLRQATRSAQDGPAFAITLLFHRPTCPIRGCRPWCDDQDATYAHSAPPAHQLRRRNRPTVGLIKQMARSIEANRCESIHKSMEVFRDSKST